MDISHNAESDKSPPARDRLPNRRSAINISFERDGARFEMTAGYYLDGRVGEVFVNADRANSLLDEIRHALKRDVRGHAASPIGAALDKIP